MHHNTQANTQANTPVVDGCLLEIVLRWQGRVVDVKRLLKPRAISVGAGHGCDLQVAVDGGRHELVTSSGELRLPPGAVDVVADGSQLTFGLGLHRIELRRTERSPLLSVAAAFDAFWGNVVVVVTMGIAALLAALLLAPTGMNNLDDDLLANPARYQTLILKPKPKDSSFLQRLQAPAATTTTAQATKKTPAKKATTKTASSLPQRKSDAEIVNGRLGELFGDRSGVVSVLGGSGNELLAAVLGGLSADNETASSSGALQLRDRTGRDTGTGTLQGGPISTRGRGDGKLDYGHVDGELEKGADRNPTVEQQKEVVTGSLDPAIIRRIVREHAGQVRYCYERELPRTPGLTGKIVMKWTINHEGHVVAVAVTDTSLKNAAVESCLSGRVATWKFPKPKGGGVVVVNYPFVFKQTG